MRIVLVRLSALGDIIHTWPLAAALRRADPHIHLSWVVEEPFRSLVEGHPAVDAVFTTRTRAWRRRPFSASTRAEIASLKTRFHELQPDLTIDSQGLLKSAVVTRWTGAPRRVGLARPWRRERFAGFAYTEVLQGAGGGAHVAATNLELVRAAGIDPPALEPPDGSWLLDRAEKCEPLDPGAGRPFAVILPGAGGAHKILAESTLATVSRSLASSGLEVVVAWGPGEHDRARGVVDEAGPGVSLAPPTSIVELAALFGAAALVIGGDTGPVHLAASLGTPTVAVFLASDWRRNGPLGPTTAVVRGTRETTLSPTGSARAEPGKSVESDRILNAALALINDSTSQPLTNSGQNKTKF